MARGEPLFRQWRLLKMLQAHRFGISADELAERLGIGRTTLNRWIRAGKLPKPVRGILGMLLFEWASVGRTD